MTPSGPPVVTRAMVPQAACRGSTPSESKKRPRQAALSRKAFRFLEAPVGSVSPFQSRRVSKPSIPTKFGRVPQTDASIGPGVGLRSS